MLNEGIDIPEADVIVFLRATESQTVFFQQLGRGLRISGEKRTVLVLDYVANLERISMILEMEETAKAHTQTSPTYPPSASKPDPIIVNIPATKFRVERVDIERLLCQKRRNHCYGIFETEEEMAAAAHQLAIELGHPDYLVQCEIESNAAFPCASTIRQHYGSFGGFLVAMGLTAYRKPNGYFPTKSSVRAELQEIIRRNGGKAPSRRQLEKDCTTPLTPYFIYRFYDSYNEAMRDAGASLTNQCRKHGSQEEYSDERMQVEAQKMRAELGRAPTVREWDANPNTCSASMIAKRHGSYRRALKAYGL